MRVFLLVLVFLLSVVASSNYKQFLESCLEKNNDGECNLMCRNFTSVLNNLEEEDCTSVETQQYTVTITVDLYPPEVFAYLQKAERLLREAVESQVELASTDGELNDVIEEYRRNVSAYVSKSLWPMNIKFYVFLPICDKDCPQGEDYLQGLLKRPSHVLKYRDVSIIKTSESSMTPTSVLFVMVGFVVVIAVLGGVATIIGERRTVNSRKRRFVQAQTLSIPTDVVVTRSREGPISDRERETFELPSPPNIPLPNIADGVVIPKNDIAPHYQSFSILRTNALHDYISSLETDAPDRQQLMYFIHHFGVNSQDDEGCTPFVLAVRRGNYRLAKRLLEEFNADGNIMDAQCMTALHHAVENMDLNILTMITSWKELVEKEVDGRPAIDAISKSGMTPLKRCATNTTPFSVPMARVLLDAGASFTDCGDSESPDFNGKTVLHYAAEYNNKSLFIVLLEYSEAQTIIDAMDINERTALWYACSVNGIEVVRILLENGADQFRPDGDEERQPRTVAEHYGFQEILRLLKEFCGTKFVEIKKSKKGRRPRKRRSSGYFSGTSAGECSPPPPKLSSQTSTRALFGQQYQKQYSDSVF